MIRSLIAGSLRVFSGSVARWQGCAPEPVQRVYFANHTSNLDGPVLWASLPAPVRDLTRLIGAKDYWTVGRVRPFLAFARGVDRPLEPWATGPNVATLRSALDPNEG